jgi:plastocyanin
MRKIILYSWIAALVACTSGTERPVVSFEAKPDTDGVQRVNLDMHSYYFEPNRIVVHTGQPVEIKLHNSSHIVPHNFSLSSGELNVSESKWGWGSDHVRFMAPAPGEYRFFCHKGSHEKKGMTGTLVVVP